MPKHATNPAPTGYITAWTGELDPHPPEHHREPRICEPQRPTEWAEPTQDLLSTLLERLRQL